MRLIVGLGNPGPKYAANRHNVGFMAVDAIVRRHSFASYRRRFQSLLAEGEVGGVRLMAQLPLTFMNESGRAVGEAMRYYKLEPKDVLIVYDELDLAPGKVKVRFGGGTAGHNGIRSIDAHIGPDFWRLRIGIGHPGERHLVHPYVLSDFFEEDRAWLEKLLDAIADAFPLLAKDEESRFMTKLALLMKPPKPAKETKAVDGDGTPADEGDRPKNSED
ncbi:MAG TPA: aminoacyl-tRNA hydrolase [Alphaproteobacteria bacterium]|nr:aminoacyl-tRNA hydrolase [Alphaproteobacteria bacterium]